MLYADINYIDDQFIVHEHAYVGTRGSRIAFIGSQKPEEDFGEIYDGRGKLLVSGFFNTHSHTPMSLLRGYGENLSLADWLNQRIFPFEAHLTDNDVYWATLLGAAEMLRFGIVSTTEMYMNGNAMARAFVESGVKVNLAVAVTNFDGSGYRELPRYQESLGLKRAFHQADDGRILIDLSLHAEYTSHEKLVRSLAEVAAEEQLGMHVHVSETADEVQACRERHQGKSPVQYLSDCGLFDTPTTAAHCVHIDEADIAIMAEKGVSVASCPKSNLKLASGICPVPKLLAGGVNVALATDSVASNNNLNIIEEMRFFALLHKGVNADPTLIPTTQALYAATMAGARSQRREDCGAIKPGNRADLVVLDIDQPQLKPAHDLLNNLIYSATGNDVVLTMVDGAVRYRDGQWPGLDIERICFEAEASCRRILAELAQG